MKDNRVFFVATDDKSFWDMSSDKLIFAERGLLRYKDESNIKQKYEVEFLKPICENIQQQEKLQDYLESVKEKATVYIVDTLNKYHHCNYDETSWKLLTFRWAHCYVNQMYRCFINVKSAKKVYPDIVSYGVDKNKKKYVISTSDYINRIFADSEYVMQLYTYAFDWFDIPYKVKATDKIQRKDSRARIISMPNINIRLFIQSLIRKIDNRSKVVLDSVCLDFFNLGFSLKTLVQFFCCSANDDKLLNKEDFVVDYPFRENTRIEYNGSEVSEDDFISFLFEHILSDIPIAWLEGIEALRKAARRVYPKKARAIISSTGFYASDILKIYAVEQYSRYKARIIDIQHGGSFGMMHWLSYLPVPGNLFYSWGWGNSPSVKRMPAGKLCDRKKYLFTDQRDILYSLTCLPCFFLSFPYIQDGITYTERIESFLTFLPVPLRKELTFRKYQTEYTWDISARLRDSFPDLRMEDWSVPIIERMYQSRMFVVDYLSTTWIEALSLGIPTVIVFDLDNYVLTEEAKKTFALLESVKVYHRMPDEAAKFVTEIYEDAWGWWNQSDVQAAVRQTLDMWGWTPDNWKEIWRDELIALANGSA